MRYITALTCVTMACSVGCRPDTSETADPFDLVEPDFGQIDSGSGMPDEGMVDPPDMQDVPDFADMNDLPDASLEEMDMQRDMTVEDMPLDMTVEPLRQVVSRGLMGDMPMANYFKDPEFSTVNQAYTWLVTPPRNQGFNLLPAYRHVDAESPMRSGILRVPKDSGRNVLVYGEVLLHPAKVMTVSVWIGRVASIFGGSSSPPTISVYAMNVSNFQDFSGAELSPVEGSEQAKRGMFWTKYEATVTGFAGYGYLTVRDSAMQDLFVHAPVAEEVPVNPNGLLPATAPTALVSEPESNALRRVNAFVYEKRATPAQASDSPTPYPF